MPVITRNEKFESKIHEMMVEDLKKSGEGRDTTKIHVSDLLSPRLSYFKKIYGNPEVSEETLGYFISGTVWHKYLQNVIYKDSMIEKEGEYAGVIATVDAINEEVHEIKTSRKYTVPDEPEERYIRQLMYYMAIFKKNTGVLLVIYFTAGRTVANNASSSLVFRAWKFEATDEELEEIREEVKDCSENLQKSLDTKEFHNLPLCPAWMCGKVYNGKIESLCPFYEKCKPIGRYPEDKLLLLNKRAYSKITRKGDERKGDEEKRGKKT